jgi:hypothetical protein
MTFLGDGYALCSHYRTCKSAEQASAAVSVATATSSSRDGAEATANFTNEDSPFIHRLDGQSSQSPVIGRPLIQPGPRMDGKGIECNLADAIKSKLPANDDLNTTNNLSINYSDINQITNVVIRLLMSSWLARISRTLHVTRSKRTRVSLELACICYHSLTPYRQYKIVSGSWDEHRVTLTRPRAEGQVPRMSRVLRLYRR